MMKKRKVKNLDETKKEVLAAVMPYLQIVGDMAIDELRARHQYKLAQNKIHEELPKETHKICYDELNATYAKRAESREAAESIANLDIKSLRSSHIPDEHLRYLMENNVELISRKKLPTYIDSCIPELLYNVSKGADIEIMHLFVLHYAITGRVYRKCDVVELNKHEALKSLARLLDNPTEQTVVAAITKLCNVEAYDKIDMFQFGISMNILTKEIEDVDSQTALRNFLLSKGLSEEEIQKCTEELLAMIPKSSLQQGKDRYELALKYAPVYLEG